MVIDPAIVISACGRPVALSRLLSSLANAVYEHREITLIISIDKSETPEVISLAEKFQWDHGQKHVVVSPEKLGLKNHILKCGDLSLKYGAIIMLEDDLMVSPHYYTYAKKALEYYGDDEKISGISLYNYEIAESCFYPFAAVEDDSDVYFMQVASSWGQVFTKGQWTGFRHWFSKNPSMPGTKRLPEYIRNWGEHSWKKHFINYLIEADTYFVFPRTSLATNFEEPGTNSDTKNIFQAALRVTAKNYQFKKFESSHAIYDAWFEILPACLNWHQPQLGSYDYAVDLYGSKKTEALNQKYILTSKKGKDPVLSFGSELHPLETNVLLNHKGSAIGLYQLKGHVFTDAKLNLFNPLSVQRKEDEQGISAIVIAGNNDEQDILKTVLSIGAQSFENKECLIVSGQNLGKTFRETLRGFNFPLRIFSGEGEKSIEKLTALGIRHARKGIISFIKPGSEYTPDSFQKAGLAFTSNLSTSWLTGIDEEPGNHDSLNVRPYRLNEGEAYKRLSEAGLNMSLEINFLRKHCLDHFLKNPDSLHDLFFDLISIYQRTVMVAKLGDKTTSTLELIPSEKKRLLEKYRSLKSGNSYLIVIVDFFLRVLPRTDLGEWFYTSFYNFPPVLRYDPVHSTFYTNKK